MCSIDGCTQPIHVQKRGWCRRHYLRWHRFGDPLGSAPKKTPAQRYLEKVDKRGPDECWPWTGAYTSVGRGAFRWNGKTRIATRVGWEVEHGETPGDLHVCHTCDHGWCHNPRHWFLGTHQDNMTDLKQKNLPRGRPVVTTPAIDAEIDAALLSGESRRSIASRFGVSRDVIDRHAAGRRKFVRQPAPQRRPS